MLGTFLHAQPCVATDVVHFWEAYDKITATPDTVQQLALLQQYYLAKATPGLVALQEARNYTPTEYLHAINDYPEFWRSVRSNTTAVQASYPAIEAALDRLRQLYPALRPVPIYFAVGVFRTNGTATKDMVMIGSELALADDATVITELPAWRQPFFREYEPLKNIALLCTHEYVHTQQNELVENLLSMCLYEGIAEFVSCTATGMPSNSPAIAIGKARQEEVVRQFVKDLFLMSNNYDWMWGENRNALKTRDLGYYIGYEIAERHYQAAKDPQRAIRELIELDFHDEAAVERLVDGTRLLPAPLRKLNRAYEKQRPTVVSMDPFRNGAKGISPGRVQITLTFSEPLNGYNTGLDFGPLGEEHCPRISPNRTWSADNKNWTFEVDLEPKRRYQLLISNNFRLESGVRLKPYLIEFTTGS
ncbi:Ig-like domain-containing protein [Neolewinella lacunae]|uniref:DUF2268 domain-containing protein n=1 Tax=Neolewinella lacunae TaxID=1517758 RepID=A0A923T6H6_9BACT|nr:Ig-like domain-containing protein [Neolewinella lacunae]MBC6993430.1 hypothetical protein [Neolewinella lacunae]MDN3636294.1 Ig-like domain-containing protein [Neolewinella lacunae]